MIFLDLSLPAARGYGRVIGGLKSVAGPLWRAYAEGTFGPHVGNPFAKTVPAEHHQIDRFIGVRARVIVQPGKRAPQLR